MLRTLLQAMTQTLAVDEHEAELERIGRQHPHTILVLDSEQPVRDYTCLMYVFDFQNDDDYADIARFAEPETYAGAEFGNWLVDSGRLVEVASHAAQTGDLVFYFDNGQFKHVGFSSKGRVRSKWGLGHLLDHALLEVPVSYGNEIRFFHAIDNNAAYELFVEFAKERGVRFEGD